MMSTSARVAAVTGGVVLGAGMGASLGVTLDDSVAGGLTALGLSALWAVVFHQAAVGGRNGDED